MANEVHLYYPTGGTHYFVVRCVENGVDTAGEVFKTADNSWGAWDVAASHDIALASDAGQLWKGTFDTDITKGWYTVVFFLQVGGAAADADPYLGSEDFYWNGTARITEAEYALQVVTVAEMAAAEPPAGSSGPRAW